VIAHRLHDPNIEVVVPYGQIIVRRSAESLRHYAEGEHPRAKGSTVAASRQSLLSSSSAATPGLNPPSGIGQQEGLTVCRSLALDILMPKVDYLLAWPDWHVHQELCY